MYLLHSQDGGYYSAEDADSYHSKEVGGGRRKKKEGAFCVWTYKEISSLLAETISSGAASSSAAESDEKKTLSELFCHHYGVKNAGNVAPEQVRYTYFVHSILYSPVLIGFSLVYCTRIRHVTNLVWIQPTS